ncbi:MAG: DUF3187 family protein, partial [Candidatus Obscuribacterales bacterium]|nr:DUF3187 family protein [Steroidobacteraceae bacterium]
MTWRAACLAALCVCPAAFSAPFNTTDQNPLLMGLGLPPPWSSRIAAHGSTSIDSTLNWSTTAAVQASATENLTIDSETRDWRLSIEHAFTDRIALRLQVPYRSIGAGSLDGFIDNWHSFFGLPEGDRPLLADNQFAIRYRRNGLTTLNVVQPQSGLGDIRLDAGYQLLATTSSAMSLWLGVKLPTSDDQSLASDSVDVSTGLATTRKLSSRWQTFGQVAV